MFWYLSFTTMEVVCVLVFVALPGMLICVFLANISYKLSLQTWFKRHWGHLVTSLRKKRM